MILCLEELHLIMYILATVTLGSLNEEESVNRSSISRLFRSRKSQLF